MKSSKFGTLSEQKRHAAGWYSATNRPQCNDCAHVDANYPDRSPPFDKPTFRCTLHDFATAAGAACQSYKKGLG